MKSASQAKWKMLDLSLGCFGWFLVGNVVLFFLVGAFWFNGVMNGETIGYAIHVFTLIAIVVLFVSKKYWVCVGVASAIFINICLWIMSRGFFWAFPMSAVYALASVQLEELFWYAGMPLPVAYVIIALVS